MKINHFLLSLVFCISCSNVITSNAAKVGTSDESVAELQPNVTNISTKFPKLNQDVLGLIINYLVWKDMEPNMTEVNAHFSSVLHQMFQLNYKNYLLEIVKANENAEQPVAEGVDQERAHVFSLRVAEGILEKFGNELNKFNISNFSLDQNETISLINNIVSYYSKLLMELNIECINDPRIDNDNSTLNEMIYELDGDTLTIVNNSEGCEFFENLLANHSNISSIIMRKFSADFTKVVNKLLPNLLNLTIEVDEVDFGKDEIYFQNVKDFRFIDTKSTSIERLKFKNLQSLFMLSLTGNPNGWIEFLKNTTNLKTIHINTFMFDDLAERIIGMSEEFLPQLTEIKMNTINPPFSVDALVQFIEKHPNLDKINLFIFFNDDQFFGDLQEHLGDAWDIEESNTGSAGQILLQRK